MNHCRAIVFACLCFGTISRAQVTYTGPAEADAFLATGSPSNPAGTDLTGLNFGAAGVLDVSGAATLKGEFQSVVRFNLSNAITLFNSSLGTNQWSIGNISLELTGNFAGTGEQPDNGIFNVITSGDFVIEWLSYDNWQEGTGKPRQPTTDGVTYDSLPTLLSGTNVILCTNTYVPPGDNVPLTWNLPLKAGFTADVTAGGEVTLLFYPGDDQVSYLFNSHEFGGTNQSWIKVTAVVPFYFSNVYFTNGGFQLSGVGAANFGYQVQANTDLTTTNWQTLGTATANTNGLIQFEDTTATNGHCFYRLALPP